MKHIKLFEGYTDEELDSLRGDLHSIGSDERFELGKDFGIGGGFNKPNNGQYFPRISSKMFNFLLDKGEIEKGESRYDYYYFINQEKFGIPPNLPKIRIKNNPRDNDYKIVMDESYLDEKSEKSIELVYEDMMKKLGEIRI
jgi:spermidine/putrescine-binding protein